MPMAVEFEGVNPILQVRELALSLTYYVEVLGFELQWGTPAFACVGRGKCSLFLAQGDQGNAGGWVWIGVTDASALHEEYVAAGAKIRHPPTNYPWAWEMQVEDPDGNVLRIGSEPHEGEPFGEWLDMYGVRWALGDETE
jgi:predicted enzyme related to lactoylglutathione lyase